MPEKTKPIFETENDLLYWMLEAQKENPLQEILRQIKTSALDDEQASFVKEYMSLINGLEAEEKIGGLDLDIAKNYFADEVLQHAAIGVGRGGFGFRMTRSQFAESVQNVYKNEPFGGIQEDQGAKSGLQDFASKIPKPNPDRFKSRRNRGESSFNFRR